MFLNTLTLKSFGIYSLLVHFTASAQQDFFRSISFSIDWIYFLYIILQYFCRFLKVFGRVWRMMCVCVCIMYLFRCEFACMFMYVLVWMVFRHVWVCVCMCLIQSILSILCFCFLVVRYLSIQNRDIHTYNMFSHKTSDLHKYIFIYLKAPIIYAYK